MELKTSSFKFAFKIEPAPGGGFLARCADSGIELQAPTLQELQAKLRNKMRELTGIGLDLDLPTASPGTTQSEIFHIEKKFTISRSRPEPTQPVAPGGELLSAATSIELSGTTAQPAIVRGSLHVITVLLLGMLVYWAAALKDIPQPQTIAILSATIAGAALVLARRRRR